SASSSTGAEIEPGMWSSAYSEGERLSMMQSNEERSIPVMGEILRAPCHGGGKALANAQRAQPPVAQAQPFVGRRLLEQPVLRDLDAVKGEAENAYAERFG